MPPDDNQAPITTAAVTREEAYAAFLAAPLLPEPDQLRLEHISARLALLIEGPFQTAAIALITHGRTPEKAAMI